jgi:hypothetical protein
MFGGGDENIVKYLLVESNWLIKITRIPWMCVQQ